MTGAIFVDRTSSRVNAPLTVTGKLAGYATPPTLVYALDGTLSVPPVGNVRVDPVARGVQVTFDPVAPLITTNWSFLPTGAVVTTAKFSFQLPANALSVGSHTVAVGDRQNALVYDTATVDVTRAESNDATVVVVHGGGSIVGSDGAVWTLTDGGQVAVDGVVDARSANVVQLYYQLSTHRVYQQNLAGSCYYKVRKLDPTWTGPVASPQVRESPDRATLVLHQVASPIVSADGNQWTITSKAQVAVNGTVDAKTASVVKLVYLRASGGRVYQQNLLGAWYYEVKPGSGWVGPVKAPV